jgi:hypothetical protein
MKLQSLILRNSLFFLTLTLAFPAFRAAAQSKPDTASTAATQSAAIPAPAIPVRITQAIDETQLVRLRGNVHPLARTEFDRGPVSDATPMNRMLLLLQRSPEQEAALQQFMADQQSKDSPNFHKWLTPEQFGKQFGPADADIQTVTDWLTRQGFQNIKVGAGRTAIEFSGNAGQVRNAFHTEIHHFNVNGESRQANLSDPQIPAALFPVASGILSLHNFPRKSMRRAVGAFTRAADGRVEPQFTGSSGQFFVVGPADFAKIYNIPSSLDGTGQTIALVADSNINVQDVTDFRNLFGLTPNFTTSNVILNGPDPGLNGDEGEADLDVQVSGMVAPKATINLVVSEDTLTAAGIDLSALYIVDNNIASVMSESFGVCEPGLGTGGNAFYSALWEQGAAQGITVMVSAGDPGSAGCDNFALPPPNVATHGLAVSGIASTPFNVAVGGTDFDDVGNQNAFWAASTSPSNQPPTRESALGYIPEVPWNDSCAAAATSATLNTVCANPTPASLLNIVAGSGGPSSIYVKPAWQSGIIPSGIAAGDNHRYTPDVSLFASDGPHSLSFYLTCQADAITAGSPPSCVPDSGGHFSFLGSGGTSASSPAFAGIMALIDQQQAGPQGNPNPVLYKIAATSGQSCNSSTEALSGSTCSFNDVTKGNNSVPCAGNSPNCSSKTANTNGVLISPASPTIPAWTAAAGYDLTTGLGSVNVTNLATQWPLAVGNFHATTTSLTVNGSTSPGPITHGASVTVKATVTSTSAGTITGDVGLIAPTTVNGGIGNGTLSGGSATITTSSLPGGTYNLTARYAGDTNFASSLSSPGVPVTVNKENSRLQYSIVTFDANGNILNTTATSVVYGSAYILRMDILNSTTNACQPFVTGGVTTGCAFDATGTVTFTDSVSGTPPGTGAGTFTINTAGHAENQPIQLTGGTHNLSATYSGDISYNPVSTPVLDSVTVSQAATATSISPSATSVMSNQSITLSVAISTQSNSAVGPTGNVTFMDGTATIGTAPLTPAGATTTAGASATATLNTSFTTNGTHSLTAVYPGDANYATSTSAAVTVTVTNSFTLTASALTPTPVTAGSSATSTITVTPAAGSTGTQTVSVTCSALPPGVTCSPNPLAIVATGAAGATGQLTVTVAAPSSTTTAMNLSEPGSIFAANYPATPKVKTGWWTLSGGTGFAAIFLLLFPGRKRYRAAFGLGLVCVLSFALGCGGSGGGGGGLTATVTHLTVSSTKVASSGSLTVSATVTGGNPLGTVQFFVDGAGISPTSPLSGGTTGNITLSSAFQLIGTHTLSAHYLGDASTTPSQSGTLNITVTGTTQLPISASPASSNGSQTLSITIN